jgi:ABC-2 type transport system permease protein
VTSVVVWRRLVRAEWIKLRSLRSTYLIIGVAVALGLGVGLLELSSAVHNWSTLTLEDKRAFDPVGDSFSGFQFAELAFGALGVLAVTSEYATGTIVPTLVAAPRRGVLVSAKAFVVASVTLVICETCTFTAFSLGQLVLADRHLGVGLSDPHVLRAVISAGLYMTVVTMVGFGLGGLIRHTGGAVSVMVGLVFLAWPIARAFEGFSYLPDRWLLVNAADALVTISSPTGPNAARTPSLTMACVELVAYVVVFLGLGAWRIGREPS